MKCPVLLFVIDPAVEPVGTVRNASRRFARTCGKTVFVFPHVRQFPSGCPLLSFLVLFSFFTLPIPIGVGFHDPATIGVAPGIAFKRAPQDLACRVITTQDMGSVMNTDRLVQMFTNQHSASRHTEAECLLRDL